MRNIFVFIILLSQSLLLICQSDQDLELLPKTQMYVSMGKYLGAMHNKSIECGIENLENSNKALTNENLQEESKKCMFNSYRQKGVFDKDSSKMKDAINLSVGMLKDEKNSTRKMTDTFYSLKHRLKFDSAFSSIERRYVNEEFSIDDSTFVNNTHDSLLIMLDNDTTMSENQKRNYIMAIQIHRYDMFLWINYDFWKAERRKKLRSNNH